MEVHKRPKGRYHHKDACHRTHTANVAYSWFLTHVVGYLLVLPQTGGILLCILPKREQPKNVLSPPLGI